MKSMVFFAGASSSPSVIGICRSTAGGNASVWSLGQLREITAQTPVVPRARRSWMTKFCSVPNL